MPGTDFLGLVPPARGRTDWLVAALRAAVAAGQLPAGAVLPPTRTLAADLGLSRGVVVEAYRRLADEGLLTGRTGAGTTVATTWPPPTGPTARTPDPTDDRLGAAGLLPGPTGDRPGTDGRPGAAVPRSSPTGSRAGRAAPPVLPGWPGPAAVELDLSPGVPDLAAFPRAAWLRAERSVLESATTADLGYGDPRGNPRLRAELAGWLGRMRGLRVTAEELVVVAGVAQSLALLAQVLVARGTPTVAVEDPGSRGAREELAHWGLDLVGVPVDADGLQVDRLGGVDAAVLTPAHQFPTGVVLAPARRRALLDWGGLVVEDDYDAEHRYDRAPVPALHAAAPDRVAHTGSTSKSLAPGLRLGWLAPPPHLRADLVAAKHASDLGSPALPQLVLAHLLATGAYDRHLRLVRARQRRRRDAVLAALRDHLPAATVTGVAAGLHLVVLLPAGTDDAAVADRARAAGVGVQPLSWHRLAPGPPGLVLGYAAHPPDRLHEAVRRLATAVPPGRPRPTAPSAAVPAG